MISSTVLSGPVHSLLKWFFLLLTITVLVLLGYQIPRGFNIETNLQALFPHDKNNKVAEKINAQITHEFGNKILIAVESQSADEVNRAADILSAAIARNPSVKITHIKDSSSLSDQQNGLLQEYRYHLLTPNQQQQLRKPSLDDLVNHAQSALFGFSGGGLSPVQDPLNLNPAYLQQLQPALNGELVNDRLLLSDEKGQLILFALSIEGEVFNMDLQEKMNEWLNALREQFAVNEQTRSTRVLVSGVIFHAADASSHAKREMSFISVGDVLASVLLFIFSFFRFRPLLLTLASVGYGFGVAFAFNTWMFEKIHIMTLVFGTSLIGVAIDYSVHYLCKHQELFTPGSDQRKSHYIIQKLLPALSLGLLASIVGYACLLQPSLPGLQQIASFSIIGLTGSWLFVVVVFPFLMTKPIPKPHAIIDACAFSVWRFWAILSATTKRYIFSVVVIVSFAGLLQFQFGSDIRTLYKPSKELMHSEQRLQQILQGVSPNQYFLLRAQNPESLLQLEENFRREHLDPLVKSGALKAYSATSLINPSVQQQKQNYQLMRVRLYADNALASQFMRSAGFDENAIHQTQQDFFAAENKPLILASWLAVARPDQRLLWLGKIDTEYVSIIGLRGVTDVSALASFDNKLPGHSTISMPSTTSPSAHAPIEWVNRVADMSDMLLELTYSAAAMLVLAYATTLTILGFAYRTPRALLLISVPLMTTLLTLGLLSFCGVAINLFHIFGCYLILGLGMDYSIFSYTEGLNDKISQRSIWLSAITSGVSFGLLGLSSIPMVQSFGVTLLLGCCFNLWFAPLVGNLRKS